MCVSPDTKWPTVIHQHQSSQARLEITPYVKGQKLVLHIYSTLAKLKFKFDSLLRKFKNVTYTLNIGVEDVRSGYLLYPDRAYGDFTTNETEKVTTQNQIGITPSITNALAIGSNMSLTHQVAKEDEKVAYKVLRKEAQDKFSFQHILNDLSETGNIYNFDHLMLFLSDDDLSRKITSYRRTFYSTKRKPHSIFMISTSLGCSLNLHPKYAPVLVLAHPKVAKRHLSGIFSVSHIKLDPVWRQLLI